MFGPWVYKFFFFFFFFFGGGIELGLQVKIMRNNMFTTNDMWQIVIGCYWRGRKVISVVDLN